MLLPARLNLSRFYGRCRVVLINVGVIIIIIIIITIIVFCYAVAIGHKVCLTLAIRVGPVYCSHSTVAADLCQLRTQFLHNLL